MPDILFNGAPVSSVTISMPNYGVWVAQVEVASPTVVTGRCVIDVGGMLFNGTIPRGGAWQDACSYAVTGGANTLKTVIPSRFYANVPLNIPIRDILTEISQPISTTADDLPLFLPKWLRMQGQAATSLAALLHEAGASWRILGDGTLWFGVDTWPESTDVASILNRDPSGGTAELAMDAPSLRPGVTWQGERVSYVVHRMTGSSSRTEVWFE